MKKVRAIIIQDGKLLLVHRVKSDREYWVFPGGGLEESDNSLEDGLKRECREELGVEVEVGAVFSEDTFKDQHEFFYTCKIIGGTLGTGTGPEVSRDLVQCGTYEPQWIPLNELINKNVQPSKVRDLILAKL
ncbi:MAG: NUDIX domain-containing protein [Patescibacteria group bacterium]